MLLPDAEAIRNLGTAIDLVWRDNHGFVLLQQRVNDFVV